MTSLFNELKRRNVIRVAIAYVVIAWIVLQVGETLAPALHLPEWVDSLLAFFLILGFPIALFFAWAFELTPEGLKKEKEVDRSTSIANVTGRKLDRSIIALLVVALGYFIWSSGTDPAPVGDDSTVVTESASTPSVSSTVEVTQAAGASIAVLPFVNMSSDAEQEYFSDGLSEELLNLLAKIPSLRVASRTSAFSYKGKEITIPEVGRELNVGHILEGSVRKSGTKIRITAQLIEVENDAHLWSETWDRTLDDVFAIQDEIAQVVVEQLKVELFGAPPQVDETSPEVFALMLEARHYQRGRSVEGYAKAEELLQGAVKIDPQYAPAWAELGAVVFASGSIDSVRGPREASERADVSVNKALALDPQNVRALSTKARMALIVDYDVDTAERFKSETLRISPSDADALATAGNIGMVVGNFDDAKMWTSKAMMLDPLSTTAISTYGYSTYFQGNYDEGIEYFQKAINLNPGASGPHYYIASAFIAQGKYEEALERIELENVDGFKYTGRVMANAGLGRTEIALAALGDLNELGVDWAYQRVQAYAALGNKDKAFEWFDTAIEIRDRGLNLTLGDPMLDSLRDDPRFADALKRLNRTAIQ
jgi:adenylate cyclase